MVAPCYATGEGMNSHQNEAQSCTRKSVRYSTNIWPKEDDLDTIEQRLAQVESNTQTLIQALGRTTPIPRIVVPTVTSANFINLDVLPDVTGSRPSQLRLPNGNILKVGS